MSVILAEFTVNEETSRDIAKGTCYRWNMFIRKVVAADPDSDHWKSSFWGCNSAKPAQMMVIFRGQRTFDEVQRVLKTLRFVIEDGPQLWETGEAVFKLDPPAVLIQQTTVYVDFQTKFDTWKVKDIITLGLKGRNLIRSQSIDLVSGKQPHQGRATKMYMVLTAWSELGLELSSHLGEQDGSPEILQRKSFAEYIKHESLVDLVEKTWWIHPMQEVVKNKKNSCIIC